LESLGGHIIRWIREPDGARAQAVDSPNQWNLPLNDSEAVSSRTGKGLFTKWV